MRAAALILIACFCVAAPTLFVLNGMRNAGIVATALASVDDPTLLDLDGKWFEVASNMPDGVLVVIFTRSDCPISNRYAPEVRRLWDDFHPRGVEFWLVYVDPKEAPEDVRKHLHEYEYPCAGYRDPYHNLATITGATVTPEAVVFDRSHKIVYRGRIDDLFVDFGRSRSEASTHDLEDAIAATLEGRPVAEPETKAVGCIIADLK